MKLHATARTFGEATIVECSGRLVLGEESAHLRDLVKGLLATSKSIVLDLGAVSYIDSSGLGTLAGLYATAKSAGAGIKLANLNARMRDMLQMTRLLIVFDVYDRAETAAAAFKSAAR
ncbi:MAG TPA: STAS domain-containing protein [Candidatus Acidoferrales bacterium]|nr:STAS domain-containing protein [Candidatus Acidoferrales bacterium]